MWSWSLSLSGTRGRTPNRARGHEGLVTGTKVGHEGLWVRSHDVRRPGGHHAREFHDHNHRAQLEDEWDVVLDQNDGGVGHVVDALEQGNERLGLALRDAGGRLVENQETRAG